MNLRHLFRRAEPYQTLEQVVDQLPSPGIVAPIPPGTDPIGAQGDDESHRQTAEAHPELGAYPGPRHKVDQ